MSSYDECIRTNFARLRANPHGYQTNNDVAELLKAYDRLCRFIVDTNQQGALGHALHKKHRSEIDAVSAEIAAMFDDDKGPPEQLPPAGMTTTYSEHVTEQTKLGDGNA